MKPVLIDKLMPGIHARLRIDGEACVRGFRLVEYAYERPVSVDDHYHEWASVHLVRVGGVRDIYRGRERCAAPGDSLYYAAGAGHRTVLPASSMLFHIAFAPSLGFGFDAGCSEREPDASGLASVGALAIRLLVEYQRGPDRSSLVLESLLTELLAVLYARPSKSDPAAPWLCRTLDLIRAARSHEVSIAELARDAGVHPCHLVRSFREHYGITPGHYQRALRLQAAASLLARSRRSIAGIAHDLGFVDQSHLTREVTRGLGASPLRLRRAFGASPVHTSLLHGALRSRTNR